MAFHFVLSETTISNRGEEEYVNQVISKSLGSIQFALKVLHGGKIALLTCYCQNQKFKGIIRERIAKSGYFPCITPVGSGGILILKFETGHDVTNPVIKQQLVKLLQNCDGVSAKFVNSDSRTVLAILSSETGEKINCQFSSVTGIVKVFRAKSSESLEILFERFVDYENNLEEIWSINNSLASSSLLPDVPKVGKIENCFASSGRSGSKFDKKQAKVYYNNTKFKNTSNRRSKSKKNNTNCDEKLDDMIIIEDTEYKSYPNPPTPNASEPQQQSEAPEGKDNISNNIPKQVGQSLDITGDYISEKCKLLEKVCRDISEEGCSLSVNPSTNKVVLLGRNYELLHKFEKLITRQFGLFYYEKVLNLNKKLFDLLSGNRKAKEWFVKMQAENMMDGAVLIEGDEPAVLGLNKVKTRNFIQWLDKVLVNERIPFEHYHNEMGCDLLKKSLSSLESNLYVAIEVVQGEILIQGFVPDALVVNPLVKSCMSQFIHYPLEDDEVTYLENFGNPRMGSTVMD